MQNEKPKIKVLEINLGIDTAAEIEKSAQGVSQEVKQRIAQIVEEKKAKEANSPKNKEKERMSSLVQKLSTDQELSGNEIVAAYGVDMSLSPLILKIRHYLKKNHPECELEKTGAKGKPHYRIKKNEIPPSV